jgi:Zn finger protein HypA/HybF involved in hydrogenase expression
LECCALVRLLITTFKERATEDDKKVTTVAVTVGQNLTDNVHMCKFAF